MTSGRAAAHDTIAATLGEIPNARHLLVNGSNFSDNRCVNQALNQWPPNQEGLGDRAQAMQRCVRAVGD